MRRGSRGKGGDEGVRGVACGGVAAALGRSTRYAAGIGALSAATLATGCGGIKSPDLFIVDRTGSVPGARLTLLVNEEGGVRCNGGPTLKLSDSQLVGARAIQEDLHDPASKHLSLPAGARSVLSYYVRDESGTVRFSDDSSGQPAVFHRLALLVLQTAQQVCHLSQ